MFVILYFLSWDGSSLQLLWSLLTDNFMFLYFSQIYLTDEWARSFFASREASLLVIYHPEIIYYRHEILHNFFLDFLMDLNFALIDYLDERSLITPIVMFPQFLVLVLYCFMFTAFFFSYFSTALKEESTIDSDYLAASVTVEAEKEIGSLDDLVMPVICITYVFGWFCYVNGYHVLFLDNSFCIVWSFIPLVYYAIMNTPTSLLLDFGIFYICYLRGVAPTSNLLFELVYDIIALIAFYVRVLVQGVRLVLICYAYMSMHDFVLYGDFNHGLSGIGYQSIWKDFAKIDSSECSITYFILMLLPTHICNWIYELIHVFFVLTGQLIAYLAMIFWLFLFLFTFFVLYKQEQFFDERREYRFKMLDHYKDLLIKDQKRKENLSNNTNFNKKNI